MRLLDPVVAVCEEVIKAPSTVRKMRGGRERRREKEMKERDSVSIGCSAHTVASTTRGGVRSLGACNRCFRRFGKGDFF